MRYSNKGAAQLKAWRDGLKLTQSKAGVLLGVHQTTFSEWEAGKTPKLAYALRLQKLAGIPVESWSEEADRESGADVAAAVARAS